METLKIWGRPSSSNTQKVLWMVEECYESEEMKKIDVQLVHASGWLAPGKNTFDSSSWDKVVDSESYRQMNPNPTVPTIECKLKTGELYSLWESNSIVRYLAMRFRPDLNGNGNPELAATASKWMDWQLQTRFGGPKGFDIINQAIRNPPEKRDMKVLSEAAVLMAEKLGPVEFQLSKTEFLGGENFSVADIPIATVINRWKLGMEKGNEMSEQGKSGVDFSQVKETPNIDRWYKLLLERPAFVNGCYIPERLHLELPMSSSPQGKLLQGYIEKYNA